MRLLDFYIINTSVGEVILSLVGSNYPIVNISSSYITGTIGYILLDGADVATATFVQSGTVVLDSNGEGTINITSGSFTSTDPVIVILNSSNTVNGAYEAEVN